MRKTLILLMLIQFFLIQTLIAQNYKSPASPPTWTPVPNLQFNMSVIGKIQLSPGVFSVNENDILGAFVGTECRGVANPFAALGGTLFLTIGANVQTGETVTFKIYLASSNQIVDAIETIPFQNAGEVGTMASPFIFTYSAPCSLAVSPSNQSIAYSPSGSTNFAVTTTCNWIAGSDQSWCTVTPSGSGNGTILANCSQNTSIAQRTANITVTISGLAPVVVTITQAGAPGPPIWTPALNLQFNMNIIGKLQLSPGAFSFNPNDIVGAFVGAQCRGVASPFNSLGGALFLTIGSNVLSGENVTFKIFLASSNEIVNANETMTFQNAGEIGTLSTPYAFTFPILNNAVVQGSTVFTGQTSCFNALQTISVAGGGTSFLIQNGGMATMIAGQKISFLPGTVVQSGGHLLAYLTTTNTFCSPTLPSTANVLGEDEKTLSNTRESSRFKVYPNPTCGKFTIELNDKEMNDETQVRIYNMKGVEVLTKQISGALKSEFSLENLSPGIYFVSVLCDGEMKAVKLLKE